MTTNPQTLRDLGAYWVSQGGVNLGVVGNAAHTSGYHLGKDRIFSTGGLGWSDYSVKLARDKAGLTNAASAIDLGKLNGSLANLRTFSRDLVARCMTNAATRRDVREIIYSPDGVKVQRYSGIDNLIHTGPGNGDSSHTGHTHISWLRDSEGRDKRPVFAPYFVEGDTVGLTINLAVTHDTNPFDALGTATANAVTTATKVADGSKVSVAAGLSLGVVQKGTMVTTNIVALNYAGEVVVLPLSAVTFPPLPAPVTDCTAAVAAATAPLKAELATVKTALSQADAERVKVLDALDDANEATAAAARVERERIALGVGAAEAARIRGI